MKDTYRDPKLIGRWVKWIKYGLPYEQIENPVKEGYVCLFLSKTGACDPARFKNGEIKLMPIGFDPNKKHYEIYY